MNILILLAGCGLGDGSCIEETVLTYTVLDKRGHAYAIAALDLDAPSVDHRTEEPAPARNVLTEAARMGRGRIRDLSALDPGPFDALLIPGGIGLMRNYPGRPAVLSCLDHFLRTGKPIGTMCAGINFLRMTVDRDLLREQARAALRSRFLPERGKEHLLYPRLSGQPELL